jgi:RsiW-degrading membrane proteinase PrsW (M82 family)
MLYLIVNLLLALLPSAALVVYFYSRSTKTKDSPSLVIGVFLLGFAAVLPAAAAEALLAAVTTSLRGILLLLVRAFVIAALVEELTKLAVVRGVLWRRQEFDEIADGMTYTVTASLGFAFFENLMYSFGPPAVLILRGITAVPLHAAASGIMGYFLGREKFGELRAARRGLLYAVLLHGAYDALLFAGGMLSLLVIPLLGYAVMTLFRLYRGALAEDRAAGRG